MMTKIAFEALASEYPEIVLTITREYANNFHEAQMPRRQTTSQRIDTSINGTAAWSLNSE
jgi:CRP-like cAMP-binding protein